jgi:hypothetical protein
MDKNGGENGQAGKSARQHLPKSLGFSAAAPPQWTVFHGADTNLLRNSGLMAGPFSFKVIYEVVLSRVNTTSVSNLKFWVNAFL